MSAYIACLLHGVLLRTTGLWVVGGPAVASSVWRPDGGRRSGGGPSRPSAVRRILSICRQGQASQGRILDWAGSIRGPANAGVTTPPTAPRICAFKLPRQGSTGKREPKGRVWPRVPGGQSDLRPCPCAIESPCALPFLALLLRRLPGSIAPPVRRNRHEALPFDSLIVAPPGLDG